MSYPHELAIGSPLSPFPCPRPRNPLEPRIPPYTDHLTTGNIYVVMERAAADVPQYFNQKSGSPIGSFENVYDAEHFAHELSVGGRFVVAVPFYRSPAPYQQYPVAPPPITYNGEHDVSPMYQKQQPQQQQQQQQQPHYPHYASGPIPFPHSQPVYPASQSPQQSYPMPQPGPQPGQQGYFTIPPPPQQPPQQPPQSYTPPQNQTKQQFTPFYSGPQHATEGQQKSKKQVKQNKGNQQYGKEADYSGFENFFDNDNDYNSPPRYNK